MKNGKRAKVEREISTKRLAQAAREATTQAVRETFELGLPITVLEGENIVKVFPDGRKTVVKRLKLKRRQLKERVFRIK
ncbi:MAG TPA: hypothetical protein VKX17_21370 [Planctomycetota bacterium]|nr:hypothetical protein [Planctomycetota bacterium]